MSIVLKSYPMAVPEVVNRGDGTRRNAVHALLNLIHIASFTPLERARIEALVNKLNRKPIARQCLTSNLVVMQPSRCRQVP